MKAATAVLIFLVAVVAAGVWFLSPLRYYPGPTPSEAAKVLRTALPPGTSKEGVITYLNERKIEHSEFLPKERRIYAIRRDTCHALLIECSFEMVFSFDDGGKLSDTQFKEGLTGL